MWAGVIRDVTAGRGWQWTALPPAVGVGEGSWLRQGCDGDTCQLFAFNGFCLPVVTLEKMRKGNVH